MPGGSQIAQSAANTAMAAAIPTTSPADNRPRSNERSVCVSDRRESQSRSPGRPAAVKSNTQDPIVKDSAMMAAVAALSEIEAANSEIAPIRSPYSACPKKRLSVSGGYKCPPSPHQIIKTERTGRVDANQAIATATSFTATSIEGGYGS